MRATLALCLLLATLLVGLSAATLAQTTENTIDVPRPAPGETVTIAVPPNTTLVLFFDPRDTEREIVGEDFLLLFDDHGLVVLQGLLAEPQLSSVYLSFDGLTSPAIALVSPAARPKPVPPRYPLPAPLPAPEPVRPEIPPEREGPAAGPPAANGDDDTAQPDLAELRHTGRDLLFPGEEERSGHPLYSYLLFAGASEGEREERARFHKAIEAFIGQVRSAEELESSGAARGEINIFYAPMRPIFEDTTPQSMRLHFAQRDAAEQTALLKELYDHARAEVLIGRMLLTGNGPFIVSVLQPLSRRPGREGEAFLVQDLSGVPPELVALWVDEFKRQVVREATETPEHLRRLALNLRTEIAVLAEAFSITKSAVAEMFEAPEEPGGGGN